MISFTHSFNVELACELGDPNLAILVNHFQYWINHNKRLKRNFIDGRTWTYQTRAEIAAHFPYWSENQIRRMTDKLVEDGILIKANYNKHGFDKTIWYAFKNEELFTTGKIAKCLEDEIDDSENQTDESVNHIGNSATPIPHTIPHTKTNISLTTTTSLDEPQPQAPIGGGGGGHEKNFFSLIYQNTKGEACEILTSDIYRHFVQKPFKTETVMAAIEEARTSSSLIGNIFRYLESICLRLVREPVKKVTEKKAPIIQTQPEYNLEEEREKARKLFEEQSKNRLFISKEQWAAAIK